MLANMMSKNELKANHNKGQPVRLVQPVGKYDVKERIESKSQLPAHLYGLFPCWQIWCQRTNWKQITTHPFCMYLLCLVGKYDVKERIESKSQHYSPVPPKSVCWQIWCQRTNWKQITTPGLGIAIYLLLANMMSKNELKANHNLCSLISFWLRVGKYDVKERIESKSQPLHTEDNNLCRWQIWCQRTNWKQITTDWPRLWLDLWLANMMSKNELKANHNLLLYGDQAESVGKYDVKERIESKSQPALIVGIIYQGWQIWCQRTNWKQITTPDNQYLMLKKLANMMSKNELKANHNK